MNTGAAAMTETAKGPLSSAGREQSSADRITERTDAVLAAQRLARTNGRGYAFAVQWPNHWSVEDRKPSLRAMVNGRPAQVIECREDGSHVIA